MPISLTNPPAYGVSTLPADPPGFGMGETGTNSYLTGQAPLINFQKPTEQKDVFTRPVKSSQAEPFTIALDHPKPSSSDEIIRALSEKTLPDTLAHLPLQADVKKTARPHHKRHVATFAQTHPLLNKTLIASGALLSFLVIPGLFKAGATQLLKHSLGRLVKHVDEAGRVEKTLHALQPKTLTGTLLAGGGLSGMLYGVGKLLDASSGKAQRQQRLVYIGKKTDEIGISKPHESKALPVKLPGATMASNASIPVLPDAPASRDFRASMASWQLLEALNHPAR